MLELDQERRLLDRIAGGDRQAAEQLVDGTYQAVFALLARLTANDRELAADLTQEAFRKAWASLDRFDRRARFATWLHRIAYNAFLNHVRRPRPAELEPEAEAQVVDPAPGQEQKLDAREIAARLRRAVMGLPDELRFTVTARFWAELPVEEIARLEQVTGAAIRKRLKKAKAELRLVLGEDAA